MRRIIAALQVSLDGFIEGPEGDLSWVATWADTWDLLPQVDTCILGRGMYPGYEQYWRGVLANPEGIAPFSDRPPTKEELAYARFADRTPHLIVSRTLEKADWHTARIVRDIEQLRALKQQPGKDMHALGGAALVSSLMNAGLVDEVRLTVHPLLLGGGKPLFKELSGRQSLKLEAAKPLDGGLVNLTYTVGRAGS